MRRRWVLAILVASAVLVLAGVGWVSTRHRRHDAAHPIATAVVGRAGGGPVPASAGADVRDLVSTDSTRVRGALSSHLAALWNPTQAIAPAGTSITIDPNSWIAQGDYATATAILSTPGQAPAKILVGFVLDANVWRVTLVEQLP